MGRLAACDDDKGPYSAVAEYPVFGYPVFGYPVFGYAAS
jgi:hypothetical protein